MTRKFVRESYDVAVIGGGINGAGTARDLAGRGLSVLLCEKDDLASHTSSSSTKLIHGGLRYLEHMEFALVRKALAEREVLLRSAPHIMWPLRFVMPHDPGMRPAWMIRTGLFLYDHLARRELLPGSRRIDLRSHPAGTPLKPGFRAGFVYSDGWVDDARLVVLNAVDASERGADVRTRCACVAARRLQGEWHLRLRDDAGEVHETRARALVNATGPWAARFLDEQVQAPGRRTLRLVKGSHIVVPRLFDHEHAYIFQNPDRSIIFAIPYESDFTLIGTTDVEHHGGLDAVAVDAGEVDYLCTQASRYFSRPLAAADVVWSYSGVRPLLDDESGDPSAVTRDYELELDAPPGGAPLLTLWGGKITTFRKLAEESADLLAPALRGAGGPWTRDAHLPGGELGGEAGPGAHPDARFQGLLDSLAVRHPDWPQPLRHRLARCYGSRIGMLLGADGLGPQVVPGLHEAELDYLHAHEWARTAEDVLWRRTKLGLHLGPQERRAVQAWCEEHWEGCLQGM